MKLGRFYLKQQPVPASTCTVMSIHPPVYHLGPLGEEKDRGRKETALLEEGEAGRKSGVISPASPGNQQGYRDPSSSDNSLIEQQC